MQSQFCLQHLVKPDANLDKLPKKDDSYDRHESLRSRRRILRLQKLALQGMDTQKVLTREDLSRYFSSHMHKNEVTHLE